MSTEQKDLDPETLTKQIATTLGEPNINLVRKVVRVIGPERAQAFLQTTLTIEANGGQMVPAENRRRTPGGVFFHTIRQSIPQHEHKQIWRWGGAKTRRAHPKPKPTDDQPAPPPSPPPTPLTWAQARALTVKHLATTKGKGSVKLTLIGRPKQVGKAQNCIFCLMDDHGAPPSLPKGLPAPPANAQQTVAVFIAEKHWRKVEVSLKENPEDALIVDGWPYFDPARQMTVLLAQGVTTKLLQRNKREGQPA